VTEDRDWETIGFVQSSRYRCEVLEALEEHPKTPSTLAEETGSGIAHLSRALSSLRDRGLVDLLVEEGRKKGRIYGLTDDGKEIAAAIQEVTV
jgi:DNA-binding transcriptional ArsR family regulator